MLLPIVLMNTSFSSECSKDNLSLCVRILESPYPPKTFQGVSYFIIRKLNVSVVFNSLLHILSMVEDDRLYRLYQNCFIIILTPGFIIILQIDICLVETGDDDPKNRGHDFRYFHYHFILILRRQYFRSVSSLYWINWVGWDFPKSYCRRGITTEINIRCIQQFFAYIADVSRIAHVLKPDPKQYRENNAHIT